MTHEAIASVVAFLVGLRIVGSVVNLVRSLR